MACIATHEEERVLLSTKGVEGWGEKEKFGFVMEDALSLEFENVHATD